MSQVDFETLVALLAEERDPLVLEEIVCLHANDGDTQLLEKMKMTKRGCMPSWRR